MLSPPGATGSKHERLIEGGGQSVAKPTAIWYSRARVKQEIEGTTAGRYSPNTILEPFTRRCWRTTSGVQSTPALFTCTR